jgi:hypothetical protein
MWTNALWSVLAAISLTLWARGLTNHTRVWHAWDVVFGSGLALVAILTLRQLLT